MLTSKRGKQLSFAFPVEKFMLGCLVYKILTPKPVVSTVPKKDLIIALPYLGKLSLQVRTRISRIMKNKLRYCNVQFVFQTKCKISNFFTFKDKIPSVLRSGIVDKFQWGSCN